MKKTVVPPVAAPGSPMPTVQTSKLHYAAWLAAHGLKFLRATTRPGEYVHFEFADPEGCADAFLGGFVRDEELVRFAACMSQLSFVTRKLRTTGATLLTAAELKLLNGGTGRRRTSQSTRIVNRRKTHTRSRPSNRSWSSLVAGWRLSSPSASARV
jgi:hypothetical protein